MSTVLFKIRRKSDGLFSTGGYFPAWHKSGKTWNNRSALSNHINLVKRSSYSDAEVVIFEVIEQGVSPNMLQELFDAVDRRAIERTLRFKKI